MSAVAGAFAEAWAEVRVHRVRVILSLVGVFLAVFALTTVTALGQMGSQAVTESVERSSGRPATLAISAYPTGSTPLDPAATEAAFRAAVDRYGIEWSSVVGNDQLTVRFPRGAQVVQATVVDPGWGTLHRIVPTDGRWFTDSDADRFAPALVINRSFADQLGGFDRLTPTTVSLGGADPVVATIVGVAPAQYGEDFPAAYVLNSARRWLSGTEPPRLEVWVPPLDADAATETLRRDLSASLPGTQVDVYRQDSADLAGLSTILALAIRAAGLFGLALGALGVINVGLVTVRQRVREIGVRRSFGATSGRVFAAVLLESVVATAAAGALAVALSVALVINLPLELLTTQLPLTDIPPYPVAAAVEGMIAAVAVGALAGLIPATVAVRAKVIDAIRY